MGNFNQVILLGNFTRDPELTYTPAQTAVVDFGLAVNRKWIKQDGTPGEETFFIDCKVFGKRAETVNKHFGKGDSILVVGHLKFEQWEKDGAKHSKIRAIVESFEFVGKKRGND